MPTSATKQALATVELVGEILKNLPTKDLARAQRVCTLWKDLIATRDTLKHTMYLQAIVPESVLVWEAKPNGIVLWQPRIGQADQDIDRPHTQVIATLHPMLASAKRMRMKSEIFLRLSILKFLLWEPGPWQRMYLTQPPAKRVELENGVWRSKRGFGRLHVIEDQDGVTFGAVIRTMETALHELCEHRGEVDTEELETNGFLRVPGMNPCVSIRIKGFVDKDSPSVAQAEHMDPYELMWKEAVRSIASYEAFWEPEDKKCCSDQQYRCLHWPMIRRWNTLLSRRSGNVGATGSACVIMEDFLHHAKEEADAY